MGDPANETTAEAIRRVSAESTKQNAAEAIRTIYKIAEEAREDMMRV